MAGKLKHTLPEQSVPELFTVPILSDTSEQAHPHRSAPLHMYWRGIDWAVATGFATRDRMPDISLYLQKFRHSMLAHRHAFIERGIKAGKPTVRSWFLAKTAMIFHLHQVPRCPKNPPLQLLPSSQAPRNVSSTCFTTTQLSCLNGEPRSWSRRGSNFHTPERGSLCRTHNPWMSPMMVRSRQLQT